MRSRVWEIAHRDQNLEISQRWKERNRAQYLASLKRWRGEHRVARAAYARQWRARIKDERPDYARARRHYRSMVVSLLLERDGVMCFWCQQPLSPEDVTVEHVLPLIRGGTNEASNLRLAHRGCNQSGESAKVQ